MMKNEAAFTLLTSQVPKVLTKQIRLSNDGQVIKIPSAQMIRGEAVLKSVLSIEEFSELLQGLAESQALVYGIPKHGMRKAKIVTKKDLESLGNTFDVIARSNDHFEWPAAPGVMMFDYDPDDVVLDKEAVLQLLYSICPEIKDVDHLWWTSSSSNISNNETGVQISGVKGQRIYILVENARDIPRAAKVIEDRLWLAGHGEFKITTAGAMRKRVPFDMSVYQPSRLDFAAGASCIEPLMQDRGSPVLIKGSQPRLNTHLALPDLTPTDLQRSEELRIGKAAIAKPKADEARKAYAQRMKKRINSPEFGSDDEDVMNKINRVLDFRELQSYWMLHVWNGTDLIEVTVEDVLANKYDYNELLCLDPIEPAYDDFRMVGKLYLNQESPCLFTFAGGGQTYRLCNYQRVIHLKDNLHNAVNETLDTLSTQQEVFTFGGSLVTPINNKLVYLDRSKMKHLLGGIIQYTRLAGRKCDPSNDLVDGVSSIGPDLNINPITGFVDHPVIDAKLRILLKAGYNRKMRILGDFNHKDFDFVDRTLSDDEVRFHLDRIYSPFTEFDLSTDDDRTVVIAAVFSAVVRQALRTCPVFGFDAPMQGSGKTLLAETIGIIASGKAPSAIPPVSGKYDDEFRKGLTALLRKGEKVINFDNIVDTFDSASFAAAITSEFYEGRILGKSKTLEVLNRTLFLMTGNNLQCVGDMSRRMIKARLTPKNANLAHRKYEFDPREMASATRAQIISSVLSLINHWKHSGMPKQPGSMTSFSDWDLLVRQPIAFIGEQFPEYGLSDVLKVSLKQQSDSSDKAALVNLLKEVAIRFGEGVLFKAGTAFSAFKDTAKLEDAVLAFRSREELRSSQHMGNLLKQFQDRDVEGLVLRCKKVSGSWSYWVELTDDSHRQEIEKHYCSLGSESAKRSSTMRLIK